MAIDDLDYSKIERDFFYELIKEYPKFSISLKTNLNDIENLNDGIYEIDNIPSIDLIKTFPYFNNSHGEIGLLCIEGRLLMLVSRQHYVDIPKQLERYQWKGKFQFFAHSHPFREDNMNSIPSIQDLASKDNTGKIYIITTKELVEVTVTSIN